MKPSTRTQWSRLIVALSGLWLAGCGAEPAAMSITAVPAADSSSSTPFAAERDRLVGQWEGAFVISPTVTEEQLPAAHRQQLESTRMRIRFARDGQLTMYAEVTVDGSVRSTENTARWQVVESEGDSLVVESVEDKMAPERIEIEFAGPDAFQMALPEGQSHIGKLSFQRSQP